MNGLDLLLCIVLLVPVLAGLWRGVLQPVATLSGLIAGFYLAFRFAPTVASFLFEWNENQGWAELLCFGTIFLGTATVAAVATHLLDRILRKGGLKWVDRGLGAAAGAIVGGLLGAGVVIGAAALLPKDSHTLEDSLLSPWILGATRFAGDHLPEGMQEKFKTRLESLRSDGIDSQMGEAEEEDGPAKEPSPEP